MGYYHVPLAEESTKLCTTIFPFGKFQYLCLPMGIKNSPDVFQSIINNIFGDMENVQVYLDDILITTTGSFSDHLTLLGTVCHRLETADFCANVRKCCGNMIRTIVCLSVLVSWDTYLVVPISQTKRAEVSAPPATQPSYAITRLLKMVVQQGHRERGE